MIDIFSKIDLLSVGISSIATGLLGFVIFFNNRRSATSKAFLSFSLITILWGVASYGIYTVNSTVASLWLTRLVMFFATWQAFLFYRLFKVFPEEDYKFSFSHKYFLGPLVVLTSIVTLTPIFFINVLSYVPGTAPIVSKGPGLILFAILSIGLVLRGLWFLVKKTQTTPKGKKEPFILVFWGTSITFFLIIVFNFLLPSFLNNVDYIPLAGLFTFPFILFTGYAIAKHKLLDIKILSTEVLSFSLIIFTFFEVLSSRSAAEFGFNAVVLSLVSIFSIFLIKSVIKEVRLREQLEVISKELTSANFRLQELDKQKTEFLSIASHQLRTPLSILKGYIELIKDGGYGKVTKETVQILKNMDDSNEHLIKLVDDFLNISRIEQGRTKYNFADFDLTHLIDGIIFELKKRGEDKGLGIEWLEKDPFKIVGDEEKIRHVIFNFVDNAIKYTEKGIIKVTVEETDGGIKVAVNDHGFGFEKVDEANFFQKFYRGENVKGTNVTGTGLGLYVCRKFIEAHGGKVWAHSPGLGQGSEFGFWLPSKPTLPADQKN